jgi:hypothetical protein
MSRPNDWQVSVSHLSTIYKGYGGGETAVYTILKELIDCGYCYRSQAKGEKGQFGKIDYVITELKNKVPHPGSPDADAPDAVPPDAVKEGTTNKGSIPSTECLANNQTTTTTKAEADVDVDLIFSDSEKETLKNFSAEQVSQAKKTTKENCKQTANPSRVKYFFKVIQNLPKEKLKEAEKVSYADRMLDLQEQAARLAVKGENYQVHCYAQFIVLRKKTHGMWSEEKLTVSEDAIKKLESFVKENHGR